MFDQNKLLDMSKGQRMTGEYFDFRSIYLVSLSNDLFPSRFLSLIENLNTIILSSLYTDRVLLQLLLCIIYVHIRFCFRALVIPQSVSPLSLTTV